MITQNTHTILKSVCFSFPFFHLLLLSICQFGSRRRYYILVIWWIKQKIIIVPIVIFFLLPSSVNSSLFFLQLLLYLKGGSIQSWVFFFKSSVLFLLLIPFLIPCKIIRWLHDLWTSSKSNFSCFFDAIIIRQHDNLMASHLILHQER